MTAGQPVRVQIEIGRLVLPESWAGSRHELAAALEADLARLIAERGLPGQLAGAASRGGGPVRRPAAGGAAAGRELARAVYRGLGGRP